MPPIFHAAHGFIYQYPNNFSMMIIWIYVEKNREFAGEGGRQSLLITIVLPMRKSIFPNACL
jgi:hypothetical protein